ncbi:MAG TPA: AMP-binding protein [Actinomycetota bacterium]|nr:AMP-binding protein [Actinomycetota bacterium]
MIEARTLWELIEARAEATPDGQALVDERGTSVSFAELKDRSERAAAGLAARSVTEGTVVSWQLPTWNEAVVLVGALSRIGAVQNPILPILREREVGFIVRQAQPRYLVVPSEFRGFDFQGMARTATEGSSTEVLVADRELPEADPSGLPAVPSTDGDLPVRWLFYTSGTTADPKGAQHTDASVMEAALCMADGLDLQPDDRSALVFPFTHIGGIIWLFAGLQVGFTNILQEAFDPVATTELLQKEGVTMAGAGTPFHMAYLNYRREHPDVDLFPNVRAFPGGGAPKPPQLHHDIKKEIGGTGIISGYGLTEAPILTMGGVGDSDELLANTEGRPRRGVQLRAVTLDGKEAGIGEEGEIRAKAPQLMQGYLDPALDQEAFDEDGWFRTGDLGKLDADDNLTITGRLKDVIIRKGENISAKELEDLLFDHPKVADVAVIGLPDPEVGERACAVIASKEGAQIQLEEVATFLMEKGLSKRKLPERVELVDALPRNPAGKVVKTELRDRYANS